MTQLFRHNDKALVSTKQLDASSANKTVIIESSVYLRTLKKHHEGIGFASIGGALCSGIGGTFATLGCFDGGMVETGFAVAAASLVSMTWFAQTIAITHAFEFPRSKPLLGTALINRLVAKRARKLDRQYGWQPRQGIAHPRRRDDTYDRFVLTVTVNANDEYVLKIHRWEYQNSWRRCEVMSGPVVTASEEDMSKAYGKLSERATVLNSESRQQWELSRCAGHSTKQLIAAQLNANKPGL